MKRAIKITLITILSLFFVLIIAWLTANEPLPEGEPGPRAEALADRMLLALNDSAYQNLELISWKYPRGPHEYDWYKQKDTVEVRWGNMRVLLCTTTLDGSAFWTMRLYPVAKRKRRCIPHGTSLPMIPFG